MNIGMIIVIVGVAFAIGMGVEGLVFNKDKQLTATMSYGYLEKDNVWNRIRVDDKGNVICSKEEK